MQNEDQLWMDIVYRFAKQSRCLSRQVGAILVKDSRLLAEGWNSPPKGSTVDGCVRCRNKSAPGTGLEFAICCHAEANAIANASYLGVNTRGAILYCTTYPCAECAKLICGAGITEVVYDVAYPSALTDHILGNADVTVRSFHPMKQPYVETTKHCY